MTTQRLTPDQIAQVSGLVAQYIAVQREGYGPRAVPLSAQQRAAVAPFFSSELLGGTRLLVPQGERVANPDFYPTLRSLGFKNLPDQSTMARQSHSAMWSFRMSHSKVACCFTNSSTWNSIGNSAIRALVSFTCADLGSFGFLSEFGSLSDQTLPAQLRITKITLQPLLF